MRHIGPEEVPRVVAMLLVLRQQGDRVAPSHIAIVGGVA